MPRSSFFGEVGYGDTDMTDVVRVPRRAAEPATITSPPSRRLPTPSSSDKVNAGIAAEMAPIWASDEPAMLDLITATFRFIVVITENDPVVRVGYQLRQAVR